MRKVKWREHFSSKHNLMAKRERKKLWERKVIRTGKPKLSPWMSIKYKILKAALFLGYLFEKRKWPKE